MNQPPGGPPDDERPGFEPPYVPPPSGPPPGPYGPPPGPPYGPPPDSRVKPPWRSAPPGEKSRYIGFAILGFAVPWLLVVVGAVIIVIGSSAAGGVDSTSFWTAVVLLMVTGVVDLAGLVLAFAAPSRTVRSLGWGAFIALLTHVIATAIGIVVLFGWCVAALNSGSF